MVRRTVVGNLWRIYILNLEEIYKLSTTVRQTIFLEKGCCLLFHKDYWMRIIFFAHSLVNFLKHGHKWSKNQKNPKTVEPQHGYVLDFAKVDFAKVKPSCQRKFSYYIFVLRYEGSGMYIWNRFPYLSNRCEKNVPVDPKQHMCMQRWELPSF